MDQGMVTDSDLSQRINSEDCGYNGAHAPTALAQDHLDFMGDRVDTAVLEILWCTKLFVVLRPGELFHFVWIMAGEPADIFLADDRVIIFSSALCD